MPTSFAYLMITTSPLLTLAMYLWLPRRSAVIWSILLGYMYLPAVMALDLPALPALSKHTIPALFGYMYACMLEGRLISLLPRGRFGRLLVAALLLIPVATIMTNGDPVYINREIVLPGLRLYDAASMIVGQVGWLCIWALAREFLNDEAGLRQLVRALVVAFLWYSIGMLYEVRMSPQLHIKIYGFFQHNFDQMMRQGGFRPIMFLEHGLWVAILTSMSMMLAIVLARSSEGDERRRWYRAAAYLGVVLFLCKSIAALVYAVVLTPFLLRWSGAKLVRIAMVISVLVMSYPVLRTLDLVPTDAIVGYIQTQSAERAQSIEFRFDNEDMLLARAMERPLFGWGIWQRNGIFDPITGKRVSVTDGLWVILMGVGGFALFLAQFGLLMLPIFTMRSSFAHVGREVPVLAGGTALVLSVNMFDLLPNATITPVTWLFAGALLGYVEQLRTSSETQAEPVPAEDARDATDNDGNGYAGPDGKAAQSPGPRTLI